MMMENEETIDAEAVEILDGDISTEQVQNTFNTAPNESPNDSIGEDWESDDFDDYADELLKKKTRFASVENEEQSEEPEEIAKQVEEISRDEIDQKISSYDCYLVSKFIVKLLHALAVEGCRWWSQEESGDQFRVPASELNDLTKMLGGLLYRWQVKIGATSVFVFTFLMLFGTPAWQAHQIRKQKAPKRNPSNKRKKKRLKLTERQQNILSLLEEKRCTIRQLVEQLQNGGTETIRNEVKLLLNQHLISVDQSQTPYIYTKSA